MPSFKVAIIIGSESDKKRVLNSGMLEFLDDAGASWTLSIVSAHRHPDVMRNLCTKLANNGVGVFIAAAGMSAALPGAVAAALRSKLPVLGVALSSNILDGLDALLSQVRMPKGVPVGVCGIDEAGLFNAAIMACQILAKSNAVTENDLCTALAKRDKIESIDDMTSLTWKTDKVGQT